MNKRIFQRKLTMGAELHKSLEKEKHEYAYMLTPMSSLNYSEEYGRAATAFMRGAEHGYKEAIAQAKEWLKSSFFQCLGEDDDIHWDSSYYDITEALEFFEADMSKLLEDQK